MKDTNKDNCYNLNPLMQGESLDSIVPITVTAVWCADFVGVAVAVSAGVVRSHPLLTLEGLDSRKVHSVCARRTA